MLSSKPIRKIVHLSLRVVAFAAMATLAVNSSLVHGYDRYWTGASDNWSTASKWGGLEPTHSYNAYITNGGTASITATGETCRYLCLGGTNTGTVQMTAGALSATSEYVGYQGVGAFSQSGGTNTISGSLSLGCTSAAVGTYSLSGTGTLVSSCEYIGSSGPGTFTQFGGLNTAGYVGIGPNGAYTLNAGTLTLNGGLSNAGIFDLSNSTAVINAPSSIVDLSTATLTNAQNVSLTLDAHSLLIVAPGFDPSTYFTHYAPPAIVHEAGAPLTIASAHSIYGAGEINDFVDCQGSLTATSGQFINLHGGLNGGNAANVNLGSGSLYVNTPASAMAGGFLTLANMYVGSAGSAVFTHSGGTSTISSSLYLGNNATDSGAYIMNGPGLCQLKSQAGGLYVGYSGAGTFTQSNGTNSNVGGLYLGCNATGQGTYQLSGSATLSSASSAMSAEYVGYSGTGTFEQSGGVNWNNTLFLGYNEGALGTYILSGGSLSISQVEYIGGSGAGVFRQTGGTNSTKGLYTGFSPKLYIRSNGIYELGGTGILWASSQYIGSSGAGTLSQTGGSNDAYELYVNGVYSLSDGLLSSTNLYVGTTTAATAVFYQTGGTNQVGGTRTSGSLIIGAGGRYQLTGGTLQIYGSASGQGVLDGGGGAGLLVGANAIVDLSQGTIENASSMSVDMSANALLIVPTGFDPVTGLGLSKGLVHVAGATLVVPAGQGFGGAGVITDPVVCEGTILASGNINLDNGLVLSGSGTVVRLNGGSLTVNDTLSGMSGGSLSANNQYVGKNGSGIFTHSAGTNVIPTCLYLGYNAGDNGTYKLSGTSQLRGYFPNQSGSSFVEYIGYSGTGTFEQTGGASQLGFSLYLGYNSGGSGTYNLSGTGQLTGTYPNSHQYVGYSGAGTFNQSGGTNSLQPSAVLYLGYNTGARGTYSLSNTANLSATNEFVGFSGTGTVLHSGGTNTISGALYLGYNSGGSGTYNLSGTGQLSATAEYIGYNSATRAVFQQSGGTNTTPYALIGAGGLYQLSGGVLQINGTGLVNQGIFDGGGPASKGLLRGANCIIDLSQGVMQDVSSLSVSMGASALLIVPSGFDPSTGFKSSSGMIHVTGTTLNVPVGQGFSGNGTINDLVTCHGTITAGSSNGAISFNNGLVVSDNAAVSLPYGGTLTVNDAVSGMTSGSLSMRYQYIGKGGTGTFTVSGGMNAATALLRLGCNATDNGTYNLNGTGFLRPTPGSAGEMDVGYSGTGTFNQTGGTNGADGGNYLYLGYNSHSSGTYQLSGAGQLLTHSQYIGNSGVGVFTQLSGTNTIGNSNYSYSYSPCLYLGSNAGGSGTYNLSGGQLLCANCSSNSPTEYIGYSGTGTFTQSGGTNTVNRTYISVGYASTGKGTYNLLGGLLSVPGIYVGNSGIGIVNQSGGVNQTSSVLIASNTGSSGTYNLNGGTLITSSLGKGSGSATFCFGGGTVKAAAPLAVSLPLMLTGVGGNARVDTAGYTVSLSGQLSGPGGLSKVGAGTLILSAANDYTGNTAVYAGILSLAQPDLYDGSSVSVAPDAVLNLTYSGIDVVRALTLGGIQEPPGIYSSTNSGGYITGAGSLQVVVPEPSTLILFAASAIIGLFVYVGRRRRRGR